MNIHIPEPQALPAGLYDATLERVETKTSDFGEYRLWSFAVDLPDDSTTTTTAVSSDKLGPRSKAYGWLVAILGRRPQPGEDVDPIGSRCRLDLRLDEESGYNRVENILPLSPGNGAQRTATNLRPSGPTLGYEPVDEVQF